MYVCLPHALREARLRVWYAAQAPVNKISCGSPCRNGTQRKETPPYQNDAKEPLI